MIYGTAPAHVQKAGSARRQTENDYEGQSRSDH